MKALDRFPRAKARLRRVARTAVVRAKSLLDEPSMPEPEGSGWRYATPVVHYYPALENPPPATDVVTIGRWSYGAPIVYYHRGDKYPHIYIGDFCSIADDVEFMPGGNHRIDWVTTYPFREMWDLPGAYQDGNPGSKGDTVVGNDVWIGRGSRILSGVTIGDGAVVGGYSVVASDVRPYAIVVGNPASEVGRRFSDEVVEKLLRIRWWDWPDAVLRERYAELCNTDVEAFVGRYS
jgi:acetyltransferase-like isoleucine patch superfamily enzyme